MPTDRVAAFSVELTRYLDAEGHKLGPLPEFAANPVDLVPLYQAMVLTRTFDAKAVALQRTGRLGTFASSLGQEGVGVGAASAMAVGDVTGTLVSRPGRATVARGDPGRAAALLGRR